MGSRSSQVVNVERSRVKGMDSPSCLVVAILTSFRYYSSLLLQLGWRMVYMMLCPLSATLETKSRSCAFSLSLMTSSSFSLVTSSFSCLVSSASRWTSDSVPLHLPHSTLNLSSLYMMASSL